MSANFSLSLSNPAVTSGPSNVVYTNGSTGNTLELSLANNFGFALTFGGSSTGKYLQLSLSTNVMEEAGARSLTVEAPWTLGFVPPPSAAASRNTAEWTFHLFPPTGGILFPDGQSIIITLQNLRLSAVGAGQVAALYRFDTTPADDLNVSATLSVLAPYNPQLATLVGPDAALRLTPYVNGDNADNPIMVSSTPVTLESAVDNLLHLNLTFQQRGADASLVPGWDPANPPTFRISFPYFNRNSGLPAPLDLTDTLTSQDKNYNPLTSAWNFPMTLDPTNPKITQDGFWQIAFDPTSPTVPVWMITPTADNPHLFTAGAAFTTAPGPVLDLYLMNIVSGLLIDSMRPETLLYFQWNHFPGFNDGSAVYPLQKTPLTISPFQGKVVRTIDTVTLKLNWETSGAAYCLVSGDPHQLSTSMPVEQPYPVPISVEQPLRSVYTLTAVGADGKTRVTRTLSVQWQVNTEIAPVEFLFRGMVQIPSNGSALYVPTDRGLFLYNLHTLVPEPFLPLPPLGSISPYLYAVAPDGLALYLITGQSSAAYIYEPTHLQAPPRMGGAVPNPVAMGVAPGSAHVAAVNLPPASKNLSSTAQASDAAHDPGALLRSNALWAAQANPYASQLWLLDSATAQPSARSPRELPGFASAFAIGPKTGNYYIATVIDPASSQFVSHLNVYASDTGEPIGEPMPTDVIGLAALSPDETTLYTLSTTADMSCIEDFYLSKIDLATRTYRQRIPIDTACVIVLGWTIGTPWASLALSPDGAYLFVNGINPEDLANGKQVFQFAVYETATMQPVTWPMPAFRPPLPYALTMSPDGSRLIALAATGHVADYFHIPTRLFAIDPVFA